MFRDGAATVSLAAIYNAGAANYAGWAVDAAQVEAVAYTVPSVAGPPHLQLQALLAVRDSDGILYRIWYRIVALGNYIPVFPVAGGSQIPGRHGNPRVSGAGAASTRVIAASPLATFRTT